jgi:hypothetical protein
MAGLELLQLGLNINALQVIEARCLERAITLSSGAMTGDAAYVQCLTLLRISLGQGGTGRNRQQAQNNKFHKAHGLILTFGRSRIPDYPRSAAHTAGQRLNVA